jgi:hypothetical protein
LKTTGLVIVGVITLFVLLVDETSAQNNGCSKGCISGCKLYGAGRCDRKCRHKYRLRYDHICVSRCGPHCWTCGVRGRCKRCRPKYRRIKGAPGCEPIPNAQPPPAPIANSPPEVDPCSSGPCQNGGTCTKISTTEFTCQCSLQWSGTTCEVDIGPCSSGPCQHGGTCTTISTTEFTCECLLHSSGPTCEVADTTQCKTTKSGTEYTGTLSETRTGDACVTWLDLNYSYIYYDAPTETVTAAANYCRNPDSDPNGPWCYFSIAAQDYYEYCDIPFCPGYP